MLVQLPPAGDPQIPPECDAASLQELLSIVVAITRRHMAEVAKEPHEPNRSGGPADRDLPARQ